MKRTTTQIVFSLIRDSTSITTRDLITLHPSGKHTKARVWASLRRLEKEGYIQRASQKVVNFGRGGVRTVVWKFNKE